MLKQTNRVLFQKCKAVGMKSLWVLSEDDKSKLSGLTDSIKQNLAKDITIKKVIKQHNIVFLVESEVYIL